jgi:hypothetical protein
MYCCDVSLWWAKKRPILLSLIGDAGFSEGFAPEADSIVVHRLAWDERSGRLARLQVAVPGSQVRALIENAIGAPIEQAETISYDAAIRMMAAFMDLTAQGH